MVVERRRRAEELRAEGRFTKVLPGLGNVSNGKIPDVRDLNGVNLKDLFFLPLGEKKVIRGEMSQYVTETHCLRTADARSRQCILTEHSFFRM